MSSLKVSLDALKKAASRKHDRKIKETINDLISNLSDSDFSSVSPALLKEMLRKPMLPIYQAHPEPALRFSAFALKASFDQLVNAWETNNGGILEEWQSAHYSIFSGVLDFMEEEEDDKRIGKNATAVGNTFYSIICDTYLSPNTNACVFHINSSTLSMGLQILADAASRHPKNQSKLRDVRMLGGERIGQMLGICRDFLSLEILLEVFARALPSQTNTTAGQAKRYNFTREVFNAASPQHAVASDLADVVLGTTSTEWEVKQIKIFDILAKSDITYPQPFKINKLSVCSKEFAPLSTSKLMYADQHSLFAYIRKGEVEEALRIPYTIVETVQTKQSTSSSGTKVTITLSAFPIIGTTPMTPLKEVAPKVVEFELKTDDEAQFKHVLNIRKKPLPANSEKLSLSQSIPLEFDHEGRPAVSTEEKVNTVKSIFNNHLEPFSSVRSIARTSPKVPIVQSVSIDGKATPTSAIIPQLTRIYPTTLAISTIKSDEENAVDIEDNDSDFNPSTGNKTVVAPATLRTRAQNKASNTERANITKKNRRIVLDPDDEEEKEPETDPFLDIPSKPAKPLKAPANNTDDTETPSEINDKPDSRHTLSRPRLPPVEDSNYMDIPLDPDTRSRATVSTNAALLSSEVSMYVEEVNLPMPLVEEPTTKKRKRNSTITDKNDIPSHGPDSAKRPCISNEQAPEEKLPKRPFDFIPEAVEPNEPLSQIFHPRTHTIKSNVPPVKKYGKKGRTSSPVPSESVLDDHSDDIMDFDNIPAPLSVLKTALPALPVQDDVTGNKIFTRMKDKVGYSSWIKKNTPKPIPMPRKENHIEDKDGDKIDQKSDKIGKPSAAIKKSTPKPKPVPRKENRAEDDDKTDQENNNSKGTRRSARAAKINAPAKPIPVAPVVERKSKWQTTPWDDLALKKEAQAAMDVDVPPEGDLNPIETFGDIHDSPPEIYETEQVADYIEEYTIPTKGNSGSSDDIMTSFSPVEWRMEPRADDQGPLHTSTPIKAHRVQRQPPPQRTLRSNVDVDQDVVMDFEPHLSSLPIAILPKLRDTNNDNKSAIKTNKTPQNEHRLESVLNRFVQQSKPQLNYSPRVQEVIQPTGRDVQARPTVTFAQQTVLFPNVEHHRQSPIPRFSPKERSATNSRQVANAQKRTSPAHREVKEYEGNQDVQRPWLESDELHEIVQVIQSIDDAIISKIWNDWTEVKSYTGLGRDDIMQEVMSYLLGMHQDFLKKYEELVNLAEKYSNGRRQIVIGLETMVSVEEKIGQKLSKIVNEHDRHSMVSKFPSSLFSPSQVAVDWL